MYCMCKPFKTCLRIKVLWINHKNNVTDDYIVLYLYFSNIICDKLPR